MAEVIKKTSAILVPPYDHPDIILGQGTQALELEDQVIQLLSSAQNLDSIPELDAVVAPVGGGGMLSGICTALQGTGIQVFGAEPSFEGANDAERGLREGKRIETVKSLTIADGLRTPVGSIPWSVISDPKKLRAVYSVNEDQIKAALRLTMERAKLFVEPSAAVPLAVVLYNEDFRRLVERQAGSRPWNIGVIISGGNTTVNAIAAMFGGDRASEKQAETTLGVEGAQIA